MKISEQGVAFIKTQEGLRLTPYQDVAGNWTIGYGHLMSAEDLKKWPPGSVISQDTADAILLQDLLGAEKGVNDLVQVSLTQSQFDALVDFTFNLGTESLAISTLLKDLNAGNYHAAAAQFPLWDHAGGKVVKDLEERRFDEQRMFLQGTV